MDLFLGRACEAWRLPAALSRAPSLSGPVQRARAPSVRGGCGCPGLGAQKQAGWGWGARAPAGVDPPAYPWRCCSGGRPRGPARRPPAPGRRGATRTGSRQAGGGRHALSSLGHAALRPQPRPGHRFTTGAMSRFQRVILVQLVLSIRGPRCSARPVTCWDGRAVDSCRNWSAKSRGATVVFSLPERGQAPRTQGGGGARDGPSRRDPRAAVPRGHLASCRHADLGTEAATSGPTALGSLAWWGQCHQRCSLAAPTLLWTGSGGRPAQGPGHSRRGEGCPVPGVVAPSSSQDGPPDPVLPQLGLRARAAAQPELPWVP